MSVSKVCSNQGVFFVLMILLFASLCPSCVESGTLRVRRRQGYSKSSSPVGTLGVVCKCCDGEGGACRTKWDAPCSKLQCLPWKSRYI